MIYNEAVVKNYADFEKKFKRPDGTRKNGVLLKYLISKTHGKVRDEIRHLETCSDILKISSNADLERQLFDIFAFSENANSNDYYSCLFDDFFSFFSSDGQLRLDKFSGISQEENMDLKKIRCVRRFPDGSSKVFLMRPGKFLETIGQEYPFYRALPLQVRRRLQEIFAEKWECSISKIENLKLFVDDNFHDIYSSECLFGDFHSCEVDTGDFYFYKKMDALAAYLKNGFGKIVARCIIYTKCHSEDFDCTFRLADRQYAANQSDYLKLLLIDRLITGGYIDGYKRIGSGCHDPEDFLWNDGLPTETVFWIDCKISENEKFSYQDSFKYFSSSEKRLYNSESEKHDQIFENC